MSQLTNLSAYTTTESSSTRRIVIPTLEQIGPNAQNDLIFGGPKIAKLALCSEEKNNGSNIPCNWAILGTRASVHPFPLRFNDQSLEVRAILEHPQILSEPGAYHKYSAAVHFTISNSKQFTKGTLTYDGHGMLSMLAVNGDNGQLSRYLLSSEQKVSRKSNLTVALGLLNKYLKQCDGRCFPERVFLLNGEERDNASVLLLNENTDNTRDVCLFNLKGKSYTCLKNVPVELNNGLTSVKFEMADGTKCSINYEAPRYGSQNSANDILPVVNITRSNGRTIVIPEQIF